MGTLRRILPHTLAASLLLAAPVTGQGFEFTPFVGGAIATSNLAESFSFGGLSFDDQHLETSLALGAHAGVWITNNLSIEGTVMTSPSVITAPSNDLIAGGTETGVYNATNVLTYNINLVVSFPPSGGFVEPFLTGGVGQRRISGEDPFGGFENPVNLAFNVGAGLRWKIHPSYAIRFDVRDYISEFLPNELNGDDTVTSQNDVVFSIGISFRGQGG